MTTVKIDSCLSLIPDIKLVKGQDRKSAFEAKFRIRTAIVVSFDGRVDSRLFIEKLL